MLGHQRRQDADHHDVGAPRIGLGLGGIETGPHLGFQLQPGAASQRPWWHIEFDVVGAEFGLVGRVCDGGQHVVIGHRRLIVVVDEVAFDLHPGHGPVELET